MYMYMNGHMGVYFYYKLHQMRISLNFFANIPQAVSNDVADLF